MHDLRKTTLKKLILNRTQRYADLKPKNIEGNLFSYHLNALINSEMVVKREDGRYELSPAGKLYADRLSMESLATRAQPKIVTLIVIRNAYGEYLLYRRKKQPLIGRAGFPFGKLHIGETISQAAARELKEKTGLSANLSHRGDGYITISEKGEPISHILFHLFVGTEPQGELIKKSKVGENFWVRLHYLNSSELMPGVQDIARTLDANPMSRFFAEFNYDLDPSKPDIIEV